MSARGRNIPRVDFHITVDELTTLSLVSSQITHPYSDAPTDGFTIYYYAYEEVFGKKIRMLAEKSSPRDVYDLINLFGYIEPQP